MSSQSLTQNNDNCLVLKDNGKDMIINLNVGGTNYSTLKDTLQKFPDCVLANLDERQVGILPVSATEYFIDRNGDLFQYILNYMRTDKLILPKQFNDKAGLHEEATFYKLNEMTSLIKNYEEWGKPDICGEPQARYISISYRGSFGFGRNGQADVKFRKIQRILICGKLALCREIFGDNLNESRDPDCGGSDRYSCRVYLKHNSLENAFDQLAQKNMKLVGSTSSGTSGPGSSGPGSAHASDVAARSVDDESRWGHYSVFVFCKQL